MRELVAYLCTLMYDLPNFCNELNGILLDLLQQYQVRQQWGNTPPLTGPMRHAHMPCMHTYLSGCF